jgi:hypothetical protein
MRTRRQHPRLEWTYRGVAARVIDRHLIVTLADGREVTEDLRLYPAFDSTSDAALQRWRWVGRGIGVWWDDPDEGFEVLHMVLKAGFIAPWW